MITKHLLRTDRQRQIPLSFSWVDHRLIRQAHLRSCDPSAWALYLFLVTVGDVQGLSYYSDAAISRHLKMELLQLSAARQQLLHADLIAYRKPLYQVLSLPDPAAPLCTCFRATACRPSPIGWRYSAQSFDRRHAVISYAVFCQLRELADQKHLTVTQIAQELQLDPRTVAFWVARPTYQQRQSVKRASKLDPFKGPIVAMLERHPYTSQQVLQEIRTKGYTGGYSILKEFVRLIRRYANPLS